MQTKTNGHSLPKGWRWVKLSAVTRVVAGTTPKSGVAEYWIDGDIVWITPTDLGGNEEKDIFTSSRLITKSGFDSCGLEIVPPGSVVLSSRAPIGHLGIARVPLCTNQGCKSFVPSDQVDTEFLYFALKQAIPVLQDLGSGATFKEVSKTQLENFEIPLPPLDEQRWIASRLNEQLAAVEAARKAAEEQLYAAWQLPTAYLMELFDNDLAHKYPKVTLGDVCSFITDGTHVTPTYVPKGIPFLSVKDVKETGLLFDNTRYISEEEHRIFAKRCKPERGDVLYTKVGTTGIAKAVDVDKEFSIFVSVALLKLKHEMITPEYLEKVLNSPICRAQAENLTQGMANRNLVLRDLKRIELPLPPVEEQNQVIKLITEEMSAAETMINLLESQLAEIDSLPESLLREAFAGGFST